MKKSSSCYNELTSLNSILKKKIFIKKNKKQFESFNFFAYLKSPWKNKFKITQNLNKKESLSERNILPEINNKILKSNKEEFKLPNYQLFKLDLIEKEMDEEFNKNNIFNFYKNKNNNNNNHNRNKEDLNKNYFSKMNKEISNLNNIKSELEEILKISSIKENEN